MAENDESCRVYACVNQKGGTGKTATSTSLGVGLARHVKKVLIVDLDSQASQTVSPAGRSRTNCRSRSPHSSGELPTTSHLTRRKESCAMRRVSI